jgi:DNA mismatch endonuclease (patch repair protein)
MNGAEKRTISRLLSEQLVGSNMDTKLRRKLRNGKFESVTPERSRIMSAIHGKDNRTTELSFRLALVRAHIKGWKIHPADLPGRPDFFFPSANLAVFLDGCFWHGCPICGHVPRTNRSYWKEKIKRNKERDSKTTARLHTEGFQVLRFWEHELKKEQIEQTLSVLASALPEAIARAPFLPDRNSKEDVF